MKDNLYFIHHKKKRVAIKLIAIDGKELNSCCQKHINCPSKCRLVNTQRIKIMVIVSLSSFDVISVVTVRCITSLKGQYVSPLHQIEISELDKFNSTTGYIVCGRTVYDVRIVADLLDQYINNGYNISALCNQMMNNYIKQLKRDLEEGDQTTDDLSENEIKHYAKMLTPSRMTITKLIFNYTWKTLPYLRNRMTDLIFRNTVLGIKFDGTFNVSKNVFNSNSKEMFGDVLSIGTDKHYLLYLKIIPRGAESHVNLIQHLADARFNQIKKGNLQILSTLGCTLASDHPRNKNLAQYIDIWLEMQLGQDFITNEANEEAKFEDLVPGVQDCVLHKNLRWFKAMKLASISAKEHPDITLFRCEVPALMNSIMYGNSFDKLPSSDIETIETLNACEFALRFMPQILNVDNAMIHILRLSVKLLTTNEYDKKSDINLELNKSDEMKTVRKFIDEYVCIFLKPWCYTQLFGRWMFNFGKIDPLWVSSQSVWKIVSEKHLSLLAKQQQNKLNELTLAQKIKKEKTNVDKEENKISDEPKLFVSKDYIIHEQFGDPTFDDISVFSHATTTVILSKFAPILHLDMSTLYVDIMLHPVIDWVRHQLQIIHAYVYTFIFFHLLTIV